VRVYVEYYNGQGECKGLSWVNPLGSLVHQHYPKKKIKNIKVRLGTKRLKMNVTDDETEKTADIKKMANGICPNFVHAIDAAHMYLSINKTHTQGVNDFAMIHDSYGTHASNIDTMVECLKEAAIEIHKEDLLENFYLQIKSKLPKEIHKDLPDLPEKGILQVDALRESDRFFA
jgi:DNA-directed RNA polymerase